MKVWTWLTDDHVVGTDPTIARFFMRCQQCGRIYRHYWGCIPPGETGQIGCRCGSLKAGLTRVPEWQAAWLLLCCYVWRRLVLKKTYWDPRMPARHGAPDV